MEESATLDTLRTKFELLCPLMDERMRRQWAASEALSLKRGGVTMVAKATGLSRTTIGEGMRELRERTNLGIEDETCVSELPKRVRRPGGGRHPLKEDDATLIRDLEALIEPTTRGDPQSPLRWTCKSTRNLAEALGLRGHQVSSPTVALLLKDLGYSLQGNRKTREGSSHADRDAQFA
jgi:DDE family transposase